MASLTCPHCGASAPSRRTWAQAAVSTPIAAPAVPDMATQVRDLRYTAAEHFKPSRLLLWLVAAAFLVWVFIRLLFP